MLKVSGLQKSFKATPVLRNISFEVSMGNIVGLLGPSGSGKSTLLRCLSRIEPFQMGEIAFQGNSIKNISAHEIGLVFQNFQLFPHLTIWKNLTLAPYLLMGGAAKASIDAKARELLQNFGLADKADVHPSQLSGGQKQRIAICRTLMMDPSLLLFDEPTSALDPGMVNEVGNLISSLKRPDRLIVVATHELRLAHRIADDVLFMEHGELIEHARAKKFFHKPLSAQGKKFLENY